MAESTTTLRQADNYVLIEGILSEKKLREKEIKRGDGTDNAILGTLTIETAPNSVHTVRVFTYEHKKDGSENKNFSSWKTVLNQYKAIVEINEDEEDIGVGRESADKVRIKGGQLGINDYVGQDGALRSFPEVTTNFINRVKESEKFKPRAEFDVEGVIQSIKPEVRGEDEEETGRLVLKVVVPLFGGRVAPLQMVVAADDADTFQGMFEEGQTVDLDGDIINYSEIKTTTKERAFGKAKDNVTTIVKRELLIAGGSEPYDPDDEKAFNVKAIKQALVERKNYLEELKEKKKNQSSSGNGFTSKRKEDQGTVDISDDDLPF
jgi:hypothetical protein